MTRASLALRAAAEKIREGMKPADAALAAAMAFDLSGPQHRRLIQTLKTAAPDPRLEAGSDAADKGDGNK